MLCVLNWQSAQAQKVKEQLNEKGATVYTYWLESEYKWVNVSINGKKTYENVSSSYTYGQSYFLAKLDNKNWKYYDVYFNINLSTIDKYTINEDNLRGVISAPKTKEVKMADGTKKTMYIITIACHDEDSQFDIPKPFPVETYNAQTRKQTEIHSSAREKIDLYFADKATAEQTYEELKSADK